MVKQLAIYLASSCDLPVEPRLLLAHSFAGMLPKSSATPKGAVADDGCVGVLNREVDLERVP